MGSVLGLLLGAAAMLMISRNYAYMMQCYPESCGAYTFTKEQFGYDHGFLTAWFLKTIANKDAMTGVKHKNAFLNSENEINMAIQRCEAGAFAVVVCDVNGLKYINDNFEHKAGGNYIWVECRMICDIFDHSPAFRTDGDEFAVILRNRDYPYGSKQHAWACEITDAWGTLMDELEERIYLILSERGVTIPKTRKIDVLRPFIKEFGVIDGRGWWIKPQNASDNTTQNESMDS